MNEDATHPATHESATVAPSGLPVMARCVACGFDRAGLHECAACPECGLTRHDAHADFMVRMWRIRSGVEAAYWVTMPPAVLVPLWLVMAGIARMGESILPPSMQWAFVLAVITLVFCLVVPLMSAISVWDLATPLLGIGDDGRWTSRATRACGLIALPLLIAAWIVQFGSVMMGGVIAALGVMAGCGTIFGLRALRRDLCVLLATPLSSGPGVYASVLWLCMVVFGISVPLVLVWNASMGVASGVTFTLTTLGVLAYLIAFEACRHAMLRTLNAAGIGRRPLASAWH